MSAMIIMSHQLLSLIILFQPETVWMFDQFVFNMSKIIIIRFIDKSNRIYLFYT